jgi:hypothetical protein
VAYHKSIAGIGGRIYLVPSGANPSPTQLAVIKSWTLDLSQDMLDLRGSSLDLLDTLPVKRTVKGKLSLNDFSTTLVGAVTSGTTISAGVTLGALETSAVPATPYQITVTNSAQFVKDLGVIDYTSAKELTNVASTPATGQYSYSAGVYTFAAADTTHSMGISYSYTVAASGKTVQVAAANAGVASTTYALHVYGSAGGKSYGFYLPSVRIPNLSLSMSPDQWSDVSCDFTAFLDSNNKLFYAYLPE